MRIQFFIFIFFTFVFIGNCQKEEEYWKTSPEFKLFVLREILWQQPNCPSPNLILEKGVAYSVTLKAGERFWFDILDRRNSDKFKLRRYTINITKNSSGKIGSDSVNCRFPIDTSAPINTGEQLSSTNLRFKYTMNGSKSQSFFFEGLSESSTISIIHTATEDLQ